MPDPQKHRPVHPQWIDVTLVGGPNDGFTLMVHKHRNLIMASPPPDEGQERTQRGHAYLPRGDGKHFDYVGLKSEQELQSLLAHGEIDLPDQDDCGDADWWKK